MSWGLLRLRCPGPAESPVAFQKCTPGSEAAAGGQSLGGNRPSQLIEPRPAIANRFQIRAAPHDGYGPLSVSGLRHGHLEVAADQIVNPRRHTFEFGVLDFQVLQ